jgi:hypothetical protein
VFPVLAGQPFTIRGGEWTVGALHDTISTSATRYKESRMSLAAHLAELAEKHRLLDRKIERELSRPAATDHEIVRLKLEKLRIKEEIEKLEARSRPH